MVDKDEHSNQLVVNEVEVDAPAAEVWDLLATEAGREAWLEPDPHRTIVVESAEPGERISWWWWSGEEPPRHVELWVIPNDTATRVVVFESAPALPVQMLARACGMRMAGSSLAWA
jgi:uncharacterized protein YndB with AHSA1/START domain